MTDHGGAASPRTDLDRGALAALDLLARGMRVTEDETTWEDHAEGIRAAVKEGGIGLAIRREQAFEASLETDEFSVADTYGPFPDDLAEAAQESPAPEGLRLAVAEAIRFLNVVGDPIAAYLTLVAALEGDYPKPKIAPDAPDPAAICTCGHRRNHHTTRDVSDVVGWPCRDCRSERCHGFSEAPR